MNTDFPHICLFADERSIHTRRWAKALRDAGHRIELITLRKDPENDIGGLDLGAGSKRDYLTRIGALRTLVKKLQPDILHAHMATSYGFLASFVDHPRKVLSVWGDDIVVFPNRNFVFRGMIKRSIQKAHYITATSEFLKNTVFTLANPPEEITVVPFGVDLNFFQPVKRTAGSYVRIGIVKWLLYKYGIDYLIRAFDIVLKAGRQAELIIAGRGPDEPDFRRLTAELGLEDKIKFHGYINHADLPAFLSTLDIFVMPSVSDGESFGVAALEASATCLPVVATKVGGVPEVVEDGVSGLLVERRDPDQLAGAMIKLMDNSDLRIKMGLAGRLLVEQKYRWEDNVLAMRNLYRQITK